MSYDLATQFEKTALLSWDEIKWVREKAKGLMSTVLDGYLYVPGQVFRVHLPGSSVQYVVVEEGPENGVCTCRKIGEPWQFKAIRSVLEPVNMVPDPARFILNQEEQGFVARNACEPVVGGHYDRAGYKEGQLLWMRHTVSPESSFLLAIMSLDDGSPMPHFKEVGELGEKREGFCDLWRWEPINLITNKEEAPLVGLPPEVHNDKPIDPEAIWDVHKRFKP